MLLIICIALTLSPQFVLIDVACGPISRVPLGRGFETTPPTTTPQVLLVWGSKAISKALDDDHAKYTSE